jgi:pentatricopeptide repeat protein
VPFSAAKAKSGYSGIPKVSGIVKVASLYEPVRVRRITGGVRQLKRVCKEKSAKRVRSYSLASDVAYRNQNPLQAPFVEKIKTCIANKQYPEALAVFEEMTARSVVPDEQTFAFLALSIAHMNPKSSLEYLLKISDQYETVVTPPVPHKPGKSILARLATKISSNVAAPRASLPSGASSRELDTPFLEETHVEIPAKVHFFESQNFQLSAIFKVWIDQKCPDVLLDFLLHHHVKPRTPDVILALEQCIKYRKPEEGWQLYTKWKSLANHQVFHLAVALNAEQIVSDMSKSILTEKMALDRIQTVNEDMTAANQLPSYQTLSYLLRHWASVSRAKFAYKLFDHMLSDAYIAESLRMSDYNVVLNLYANDKNVSAAEALFESLRSHASLKLDTMIYTTMIKVYARAQDAAKAWALVGEMVRNGQDPAIYARHKGIKRSEVDVWPNNVTMSILLDMEARVNGPVALIETFEAIRNTYHLTPSLNNWGALLEQLAMQKQYIACFDWFATMMRTQSLRVTLRECCYLTLLDPQLAPFNAEQRQSLQGIKWRAETEAPPLSNEERRKWIATVYRWKDMYIRNNALSPPPELDLVALHKIRDKLAEPLVVQQNDSS